MADLETKMSETEKRCYALAQEFIETNWDMGGSVGSPAGEASNTLLGNLAINRYNGCVAANDRLSQTEHVAGNKTERLPAR